jgi:hypothetical protein
MGLSPALVTLIFRSQGDVANVPEEQHRWMRKSSFFPLGNTAWHGDAEERSMAILSFLHQCLPVLSVG